MKQRRIHLVPQFHYDVEYLLPMGPYLEVCFENLLTALALLEKHPEYTYLVEQVFLMERFLEGYPSLRESLRSYCESGRLELSSGTYTMSDLNMPSGESFMRQVVIGKDWCGKNLNCAPRVFNAGDCTGSCSQMPQMLRHCGYDYFVFERAVDDVSRKSEILWQGIDGTEIKAYWLPEGYSGWKPFTNDLEWTSLDSSARQAIEHAAAADIVMAHGGDFRPPYKRGPLVLARWNKEHPDRYVAYSTYGRGLDAVDWRKAVPFSGEWNPDRQGTYSSRIRIKQMNRMCEAMLLTAEAASVAARLQLGVPADEDGLRRGWKLTFLNQFHDTMWGTVLDRAYLAAQDRAKLVRMLARNLVESRLARLLRSSSAGRVKQNCLVVFNPLPWPRTAYVDFPGDEKWAAFDIEFENNGNSYGTGTANRRNSMRVELPALGYRVVNAADATPAEALEDTPFVFAAQDADRAERSWRLDTPLYELTISNTGVIGSLTRKSDALSFVDPQQPWLNTICLQSDRGDFWQYYEGPLSDGGAKGLEADLISDPYPSEGMLSRNGQRIIGNIDDNRIQPDAKVEIRHVTKDRIEIGIGTEIASYWPRFREFEQCPYRVLLDQTITLFADHPRLDFRLRTHHIKGKWYRLRAAFFTDIREGRILHEIPFGRCRRPEGEFAAQNYMAYVGKEKGLALLNRGLPGNNVTDGVMMLSLMRSVDISSRGVESDLGFEEGECHQFDYGIIPFAGEAELETLALARSGMEFAVPPYVHAGGESDDGEEGSCETPNSMELLRVEAANVNCTAVYPDGDLVVVRLHETDGRSAETDLQVTFPVESAEEMNALLSGGTALPCSGGTINLRFRPFEIKTVVLTVTA